MSSCNMYCGGSVPLNLCLKWISGGAIFGRLTISKRQRTCLLIYIMAAMLCMVGQSTLFLMQGII